MSSPTPNYGNNVSFLADGTVVTAAGTTPAIEADDKAEARVTVKVTAVSGTSSPAVTFNLQTSEDNNVSDSWRTVGNSGSLTATGTVHFDAAIDRFVRIQWGSLTGTTPSFTVGISGELV